MQNRTAIDFLLLAHGHSCEEYEGLCCFNLSTHGESIQKKIKAIEGAVQEFKKEKPAEWSDNPFKNWGLPRWAASILNRLMWVIIISLIALLAFFAVLKSFQTVFLNQ